MSSALQPATEIPLQIGPHAVTLRASLRVAVALEALPGGIASLWDGIARQKITDMQAVIRAAATDGARANALIAFASTQPLAPVALQAQAACLALLAGILPGQEGEAQPSEPTQPKPLRDYLSDLFRFGTGWLGWPPSEVWNASPAELEAAFMAHVDRVVMMTPGASQADKPRPSGVYSSERLRQIEEQGFDPEFDREGLNRLKSNT